MALQLPRGVDGQPNAAASGRWATDKEVARTEGLVIEKDPNKLAAQGALLLGKTANGQYVGLIDNRHCLTVAGSRAGKGTSLIVPNLALYPGSVLCIDPKGENAFLTAERRRRIGQDVYVLDPFGVSGDPAPGGEISIEDRAAYNPMQDLDPQGDTFIEDAALLADSIVVGKSESDPYWDEAARELIKGLILYFRIYQSGGEGPARTGENLIEVRNALRDPGHLRGILEGMLDSKDAFGAIAAAAASFSNKPDRERDSVLSSALRHTEFLDSYPGKGMASVLVTPSRHEETAGAVKVLSSLRQLRENGGRPATIYLCLPASRMPTHARWLRLMVNFALALLERDARHNAPSDAEKPLPILFLMDEFSSLGHMPSMEVAAGLMAGFGVKLWPFLQDLSQLKRNYEGAWETFIGNAGAHIFFGNSDLTTLQQVSGRLGHMRMSTSSMSIAGGGYERRRDTLNVSETTTPLLAPDEVQRVFARVGPKGGGHLLLLLPHSLPITLEKASYFDDPEIRKLLPDEIVKESASANKIGKRKFGLF